MKIAKILAAAAMLASCGAYAASATATFLAEGKVIEVDFSGFLPEQEAEPGE